MLWMLCIPDRRERFSNCRHSISLPELNIKTSLCLKNHRAPFKLFDGVNFISHPVHNDPLLPAPRFVVLHQPGEGFELEFRRSKRIRQSSGYIAEPIGHR